MTATSTTAESLESLFVHLHVHSSYSLLEGALKLTDLVRMSVEDGQPALAVTDRNNLFGALEFSDISVSSGLQPIIGSVLEVDFDSSPDSFGYRPILVVLCMNETGYNNLSQLSSLSHYGDKSRPHVTLEQLGSHSEGLIVLTGGPSGPLDLCLAEGRSDEAVRRLTSLQDIFGDRLYIELQRHVGYSSDIENALISYAYERGVPLVATNESYFASRDDYEAHDALLCIAEGRVLAEDDRRRLTHDHYFKSSSEMIELFSDIPEATEHTIEISRRCGFLVPSRDPVLPKFSGDVNEADELRRLAVAGLDKRLGGCGLAEGYSRSDYDSRLDYELSTIVDMNYSGYFLIVADFIKWAKSKNIPVGPGRGSGAGSLVAWALTITDLDPIRFSLLFERFLNPERISMPDFDIDFCQDRRDEVIRYVRDRYGDRQVAQIITFGTLQARAVLRDVGRVLQMPYGQVDRLCKMVPFNPASPPTLAEALESESSLSSARSEPVVDRLMNIAMKLEGLYRHASTHAAGIVIGDRPLSELVPLYYDQRSDMAVTQFNMKWVERAGLIKFDFLGLKTLTVIRKTVDYLGERDIKVDIDGLELDDESTYQMLQRGETVGVFQLESSGMRKALVGMKADCFEDIIALVALYRPGPMENIPVYNARKQGHENPDYYHPKIESVLRETHGVIIYQEQVMEIAQILSGYTLGEADMLRRAMGKKIRKEMDSQRERFVDGAVERDVAREHAHRIFDLLSKFADYGFNKSHAAAYALLSYQTAWLKSNYPVEFLAALMTLDMGNTDKLHDFYREGKRSGIDVVSPCINRSGATFVVRDSRIYYALSAIKGVGEAGVRHIVDVRGDTPFSSIDDFFSRVDCKNLNRKMLENLVCAGAFDIFGHPREQLLSNLDRLIGHAVRLSQNSQIGMTDMFGEASSISLLPSESAWLSSERLLRESISVGFYLSAHPLDEYSDLLSDMKITPWADFEQLVRGGVLRGKLAGTIMTRQERKTRTGNRMCVMNMSDSTGQYEVILFSESLEQHRDLLEVGASVIVSVEAEDRPEGISLRASKVVSLASEFTRTERSLRVFVRDETSLSRIPSVLSTGGEGRVSIVVVGDDREVEISLFGKYALTPRIADELEGMPGIVDVRFG